MSLNLTVTRRDAGIHIVLHVRAEANGPVSPAAAAHSCEKIELRGSPAAILVEKGVSQLSSEVALILGTKLRLSGVELIAFDNDYFAEEKRYTVVHVDPRLSRERGINIGNTINSDLRTVAS